MNTTIMLVKTSHERKAAITYTSQKYLEHFGTTPEEAKLYICARRGGVIIGSVGLDFERGNGKMPLEHIYRIDRALIPLPLTSSNGVQICRLIADDPLISSLPLIYASAMYGMRLGKSYAWLNHSDAVHRVFTRKGIEFVSIPEAELMLECVPKGDIPFYSTPPYAKCYIMPLYASAQVLRPKVIDLVMNNSVVFTSDFH
jgi:hypothetical protein